MTSAPIYTNLFNSGNDYYKCDELKLVDNVFFKGCSKTTRMVVTRHSLLPSDYVYGLFVKSINGYKQVFADSKTGKIPTKANIFITVNAYEQKRSSVIESKSDSVINDSKSDSKSDSITMKPLPPIIKLTPEESLKSDDGTVLPIEVRGERTDENTVYFKAKDVEWSFQMPWLCNDLRKNFLINSDYNVFSSQENPPHGEEISEEKNRVDYDQIYLTYEGMMRVLYASHSENAKRFRSWATHTLFVAQMGSREQRTELASGILGVTVSEVSRFLETTSCTKIPCVYLISLGTVGSLRTSMNIPNSFSDDELVMKYGRTDNLTRRLKEHNIKYGKLNGCTMSLIHHAYIDEEEMVEAEGKLRSYFDLKIDGDFQYEKSREIIIASEKELPNIRVFYTTLQNNYSSKKDFVMKDIEAKIRDLENSVEKEKMRADHEAEKAVRESQIAARERDIAAREREICDQVRSQMSMLMDLMKK